VADQDFFFALDVSGDPEFDQMLADVARTVLGQVGYNASAIDALTGELRAALADRVDGGKRRCDVRFEARNGHLQIVVAGAGRPEWCTTWPLPST
jgi:hypothetical protein